MIGIDYFIDLNFNKDVIGILNNTFWVHETCALGDARPWRPAVGPPIEGQTCYICRRRLTAELLHVSPTPPKSEFENHFL